MAFSPLSFLLGVAGAYALPAVTRSIRPLAVDAAALSLAFLEDARRVLAEQIETLQDIAAEARARRQQDLGAAAEGGGEAEVEEEERRAEPWVNGRGRRRATARSRSHTS